MMGISKENQDYIFDAIRDFNDLEKTYSRIHAIYCERISCCRLPVYDSKKSREYGIVRISKLGTIIQMIKELEELDNV
jgi:hypothetical protein